MKKYSIRLSTSEDAENGYFFTYLADSSYSFYEVVDKKEVLRGLVNLEAVSLDDTSKYDTYIYINAIETIEDRKGYGTKFIQILFEHFNAAFIVGNYISDAYDFWYSIGAIDPESKLPIDGSGSYADRPFLLKRADFFSRIHNKKIGDEIQSLTRYIEYADITPELPISVINALDIWLSGANTVSISDDISLIKAKLQPYFPYTGDAYLVHPFGESNIAHAYSKKYTDVLAVSSSYCEKEEVFGAFNLGCFIEFLNSLDPLNILESRLNTSINADELIVSIDDVIQLNDDFQVYGFE